MPEEPKADPPRTPSSPCKCVNDKDPAYAEESESESDSDADNKSMQRKGKFHPRVIGEFVFVKTWVIGEMSPLTEENVQHEIYETMRDLMAPSGLKKPPFPVIRTARKISYSGSIPAPMRWEKPKAMLAHTAVLSNIEQAACALSASRKRRPC